VGVASRRSNAALFHVAVGRLVKIASSDD